MSADGGTFPRSGRLEGPSSNTGQKGGVVGRALVDYLTVTVSRSVLLSLGVASVRDVLAWLAGPAPLSLCSATGRPRNFYPDHASVLFQDEQGGQLAGFVAWSDEAVCVSLSGVGCSAIKNWHSVADVLDQAGAKITRCDVAFDDFAGALVTPKRIDDLYLAGAFNSDGRPPKGKYLDDHGTGDGCTAYVGTKGYRELCCYEKGKQLGDVNSPWVRIEGRFYAKHSVVSTTMLRDPLRFLCGMYTVLSTLLRGVGERLETIRRTAITSATAMVSWLRRQCGGALHALREAFPDHNEFAQVVGGALARKVRPRRLVLPAGADTINQALRIACHAAN